ncbi:MAG: Ig-like domain repeat protein [Solirubrobacteraceae bacterium]
MFTFFTVRAQRAKPRRSSRRSLLALSFAGAIAAYACPALVSVPAAQAAPLHRAAVGIHYAKIVADCGAPAPGHARCFALRRVAANAGAPGAKPYAVRASYPVGPGNGYTPGDLWSAYGLGSLATLSATGGPGTGQTVAIVDAYDDPNIEADLGTFNTTYGLPACTTANGCFTKVGQTGTPTLPNPNAGWAGEISLDVEAVHSLCPDCKVLLVEANSNSNADLGAAVNEAVTLGATEVTNSYGGAENSDPNFAAAFKHSGVPITASAGDQGYYNWTNPGQGTRANVPAALPDVVAVGGTSLHLTSAGTRSSETVWNNNTGPPNLGAGGDAGGGGCSALFAAPTWQSSVPGYSAAGCGGKRLVSDISAIADPYTGFDTYDSYQASGWATSGGTSLSSPVIAAMFALVGGGQGVTDPAQTLYSQLTNDPSALYDVTTGGNGFCYGAQPGACTTSHPAASDCNGTTACDAAPGYDGPSGIGTPVGLGAFSLVVPRFTMAATASPNTSVSVDASTSTSTAGAITSYKWIWGDGSPTTTTTTPTTSHVYATSGFFTVSLTASTATPGVMGGPANHTISVQNGCSTSCSWSGSDANGNGSLNWSDPANWSSANTPASGVNGDVTLPASSCNNGICYSNNDISGASFNSLTIDKDTHYRVTGNAITLGAGGLTTTNSGPFLGADWVVPITLGASQTWQIPGATTLLRTYAPITGSASSLALAFGNGQAYGGQLVIGSNDEVGPVNASGLGAIDLQANAYDSSQHPALNATDGQLITLSGGTSLGSDGPASVGPLSVTGGSVGVGNTSTPVLSVMGSASFGSGATFYSYLNNSGAGKLNATGAVSLGGTLGLYWTFPACTTLNAGTSFTLIQGSSVSGQFSNAPEGAELPVKCQTNNAVEGTFKIHYTGTSVTATALSSTTTTLGTPSPSSPATNQTVTLTANVSASGGTPSGTVEFDNRGQAIAGCFARAIDNFGAATCTTSFSAASATELTASYTPSPGSAVGASFTPYPTSLNVARGATSTSLSVPNPGPTVGQSTTFTATVTPADNGAALSSGSVQFVDNGQAIAGCSSQPLTAGTSSSSATCTVSYPSAGTHSITASYGGDGNFTASTTASASTVTVTGGSPAPPGNPPTTPVSPPAAGNPPSGSPPVSPGTPTAGPSSAQVTAALSTVLKPSGKAAKLKAILKAGGYSFSFLAPSAGKLVIEWFVTVKGKQVLVAFASAGFHAAGKATVKLKLTSNGRKLLRGAKTVKIATTATFTPSGRTGSTSTKTSILTR